MTCIREEEVSFSFSVYLFCLLWSLLSHMSDGSTWRWVETSATTVWRSCVYNTCPLTTHDEVIKICRESWFLPTPPAFDTQSEYCHNVWCEKTRMVWLLDGEKNLKIRLFVLAESTNVTHGWMDRQTPYYGIGHSLWYTCCTPAEICSSI